jgi:hypothetical protein
VTEAQSKALILIDQNESMIAAATKVGISVSEVHRALAERDRRKGQHQTRSSATLRDQEAG